MALRVIVYNKSLRRRFLPKGIGMSSDIPKRLVSLDIFRGLTIAAMILVDNLSAWTDTPRFPTPDPCRVEWVHPGRSHLPLFHFHRRRHRRSFPWTNGSKAGRVRPQLYRHILSRTAAAFRSGPGGVQLFFLRLALPGHLSTRSNAEEHLGDFPLAAGRQLT